MLSLSVYTFCFIEVLLSGDGIILWSFISVVFFFFKQKTAYEMRISDWSSDVCSSDLLGSGESFMIAGLLNNRSIGAIDRLRQLGLKIDHLRSEERRVGKECVSTCRSRW